MTRHIALTEDVSVHATVGVESHARHPREIQ